MAGEPKCRPGEAGRHWGARRRSGYAGLACAILLASCKSAPPPPPPPPAPPKPINVSIAVIAAPDLNPDRNGRPSPALLRVYQLRDAGKFQNAEFDDLSLHADTTLAAALIGREERMVQPSTSGDLTLTIDPAAQLIGVVVEFSDLANSRWRASSPAADGGLLALFKDRKLVIKLDRQAVTVVAAGNGV